MRAALLTLLVVSSVASAADVKYGVSLKTETRGRTPLPGDANYVAPGQQPAEGQTRAIVTGDLELDPIVNLQLLFHTGGIQLQYAPVLIWREPHTGGRLLPLQRGVLTAGKRWERATLAFSQEGAWGLADVGALRGPDSLLPSTGQAPVIGVQTLGGVPYLRSATNLGFDAQPSARVGFGFGAAWAISGSPETTTNGLPLQYGPSGAARLRWVATRLDSFTTAAAVSQSTFVTGQEQLVGVLSEQWDRAITRRWSASMNVGLGVTRAVVTAQQGIPGTYLETLPVGGVSTTWNDKLASMPLQLTAGVRMAPFADRFTANIYERFEVLASAQLKPDRNLVVAAGASGAGAVPLGRNPQAGDWLVSCDASVTWNITTWLLLQGSVRVLWTEQPRLGIPGQLQASGAVSVTVRDQGSVAW